MALGKVSAVFAPVVMGFRMTNREASVLSVKSLLLTDKEGFRSVVRRRVYPGGKRSIDNPDMER